MQPFISSARDLRGFRGWAKNNPKLELYGPSGLGNEGQLYGFMLWAFVFFFFGRGGGVCLEAQLKLPTEQPFNPTQRPIDVQHLSYQGFSVLLMVIGIPRSHLNHQGPY